MAKKEFPSDKLDQYIVRFPNGLRDRIKEAAAANNRSMNAEIISRLEDSFAPRKLTGLFALGASSQNDVIDRLEKIDAQIKVLGALYKGKEP